MVDRFGVDERGHVGGDAVDGLAGRPRRLGVAPVTEPGDRAARAEMGAGPDPRRGRGQLVLDTR